ncbi:hypothetical protein [Actinomadura violacea]|uniref:Uncharacterized protein n=1 Tax=Actinomadura violacea TaxID=2819934 RepID=A0ABS3S7J1_9ACTN|nr:hypothetical protein [Actinomadura violacea]MBO2464970.1 hypothetical protein [Actinomadura violacea]
MSIWLLHRTDNYELGDRRAFVVRAQSAAEAIDEVRDWIENAELHAEQIPLDGPLEVILSEPHCAC